MTIPLRKRLITVAEYYKMLEVGILKEEDRVELIRGEIISMSPISSNHSSIVKRINRVLSKSIGDLGVIGIQDPIHLGKFSEPEPDISLLKPSPDLYQHEHPRSEDVFLLIEVAQSSLNFDRHVKIPLYASHQIPEVWIVDVNNHQIEVYREPNGDFYAEQMLVVPGESIDIQALGLEIQVRDLLG
ncbi:MAG: Uma2 family endonuclease [Bacteroidota bacterium]